MNQDTGALVGLVVFAFWLACFLATLVHPDLGLKLFEIGVGFVLGSFLVGCVKAHLRERRSRRPRRR
jgi:hypothetical protein